MKVFCGLSWLWKLLNNFQHFCACLSKDFLVDKFEWCFACRREIFLLRWRSLDCVSIDKHFLSKQKNFTKAFHKNRNVQCIHEGIVESKNCALDLEDFSPTRKKMLKIEICHQNF